LIHNTTERKPKDKREKPKTGKRDKQISREDENL
jgi:hypothetical protein